MLSSIIIAIGLAMDSMAVAVSSGVAVKTPTRSDTLRLSGLFGIFQCAMLLIGWALGASVRDYVSTTHHYIAFVLLSFIGIRMMIESRKDNTTQIDPFSNKTLLVMAFATSVDALAAGVGLAVTDDFIVSTAFIVGFTAFLLSALGVKMGNRLGRMFKKNAELFGGAILTLIGLKILLEHLFS
ncbi:MAG TPA: manganese efflux pump MntP family protein [Clostridia bacterium]|nr:manganese efflux pump MntP family protein [Clostridia bacterium]